MGALFVTSRSASSRHSAVIVVVVETRSRRCRCVAIIPGQREAVVSLVRLGWGCSALRESLEAGCTCSVLAGAPRALAMYRLLAAAQRKLAAERLARARRSQEDMGSKQGRRVSGDAAELRGRGITYAGVGGLCWWGG